MSAVPAAAPAVAHFRKVWFKPTETFLHHTLAELHDSRPLLIGYERANQAAFPVDHPVVALYPRGSRATRWNHRRARWLGVDPDARFHTRAALRQLARHGVRVLHAHFGYTGHQVLPVKRRTGLPLVTSFYGEDASRLARQRGWPERYAELFAIGDRFLVEGPFLRRRLIEIGCPAEKTAIQHIAIPVEHYPFRARRPRPRGEPVRLFFCASFRAKKGLPFALEAVARARSEHPALELRVAGDGPERDRIQEAVQRLGLRDTVRFLGFVSHPQMIREMDAADLFLQPSVTTPDGDSEGGAPTTLLEAQACGLPVLATRHADIPHVVADGESGLLSPEHDVDRLSAQLLTLLKEPERWSALGAAGRVHVERFHDAAQEARRLEDLYRTLAGDETCRPG
jgi:colanic acid/amylovoran biosynthesis glycosyltransferase